MVMSWHKVIVLSDIIVKGYLYLKFQKLPNYFIDYREYQSVYKNN